MVIGQALRRDWKRLRYKALWLCEYSPKFASIRRTVDDLSDIVMVPASPHWATLKDHCVLPNVYLLNVRRTLSNATFSKFFHVFFYVLIDLCRRGFSVPFKNAWGVKIPNRFLILAYPVLKSQTPCHCKSEKLSQIWNKFVCKWRSAIFLPNSTMFGEKWRRSMRLLDHGAWKISDFWSKTRHILETIKIQS